VAPEARRVSWQNRAFPSSLVLTIFLTCNASFLLSAKLEKSISGHRKEFDTTALKVDASEPQVVIISSLLIGIFPPGVLFSQMLLKLGQAGI
jgi:hypothetical protein